MMTSGSLRRQDLTVLVLRATKCCLIELWAKPRIASAALGGWSARAATAKHHLADGNGAGGVRVCGNQVRLRLDLVSGYSDRGHMEAMSLRVPRSV